MKLVPAAVNEPAKCAVTGDIDGPFVDTGSWCQQVDPYIYLHTKWVEECATKLLGMVPRDELKEITDRMAKLAAELDQLKAFVAAQSAYECAKDKVSTDG